MQYLSINRQQSKRPSISSARRLKSGPTSQPQLKPPRVSGTLVVCVNLYASLIICYLEGALYSVYHECMYALCSYRFIMIECILIMTRPLLQVMGTVNNLDRSTVGRAGGLAGSCVDIRGPRVSGTPGIGIFTARPEMNRKTDQPRCRRYAS